MACDESIDNGRIFQHLIPNARDTCSTNATVNHCLQTVLFLKHLTFTRFPAFSQVRVLGFSKKSSTGAMQLLQMPQEIIFFMPFRTQFITARLPPKRKKETPRNTSRTCLDTLLVKGGEGMHVLTCLVLPVTEFLDFFFCHLVRILRE